MFFFNDFSNQEKPTKIRATAMALKRENSTRISRIKRIGTDCRIFARRTTMATHAKMRAARKKDLEKEFRRLTKKLGRIPTGVEFQAMTRYYTPVAAYYYGNWNNFLRSLQQTPYPRGSQPTHGNSRRKPPLTDAER